MTQAITLLVSLAGTACATFALLSGDGLRAKNGRRLRRVAPRVLLALVLLACAIAGSTVQAIQASASAAGLAWMVPVLLAAGAGSLLLATAAPTARSSKQTTSERFTPDGKLALALLAGAVVLGFVSGPGAPLVDHLEGLADATPPLVVLGLALAVLGMMGMARVLRSGKAFSPGKEPLLLRLSPQARAAGSLLALALEFVGLAAWMAPQSGVVVALVLLVMGILAGMRAVFVDCLAARRGPGWLRLSPRGLAAVGLLGGAVVVLGFQVNARPAVNGVLTPAQLGQGQANQTAATTEKTPPPTVYMQRDNYGHSVDVIDKDRELRIRLREKEEELAAERAKGQKPEDEQKSTRATIPASK